MLFLPSPNYTLWSIPTKMYREYHDYDDLFFEKSEPYKIDSEYGPFHVYEEGKTLVVELIKNTKRNRANFAKWVEEEEKHGCIYAEYEIFESIWTNGLDYITVDEIGALSEAPAFAEIVYLPDWIASVKEQAHDYPSWLHPEYAAIDWEHTRIWSAIDYYQIESPLDRIAETGRAEFRLAE